MNANELADELTKMFRGEEYDRLIHEIPDMLRQQQNEIEDLKNANRFIQNFAEEQHKRAVALEMRELTDEEIHQVIFNLPNKDLDLIEFARAILRKAQEK
jgi:type I site-specific restriction endonuclease